MTLLLLVGLLVGCTSEMGAEVVSREVVGAEALIVAKVDERLITLAELREYQAELQANAYLVGGPESVISLRQALESLIDLEVQLAEAKRRGIVVAESEIAAFAAEQRAAHGQLPAEEQRSFKGRLNQLGLSLDQFWANQEGLLRERILILGKLRQEMVPGNLPDAEFATAMKGLTAELRAKAKIEILEQNLDQ